MRTLMTDGTPPARPPRCAIEYCAKSRRPGFLRRNAHALAYRQRTGTLPRLRQAGSANGRRSGGETPVTTGRPGTSCGKLAKANSLRPAMASFQAISPKKLFGMVLVLNLHPPKHRRS